MIEDLKQRVVREQIRLAMRQLPTMQGASLVVALVLCLVVRHILPAANIFEWITLVLLIVLGRIVLYQRFSKVREDSFAGEPWKNAYLILALISGVFWGLSAFIIFPAGIPALISLFVLVMASLSAATTVSHSSIRFGSTAWAVPAMAPYSMRCFMEGGEFGYATGFLIILYLFTVLGYSLKHHNSVTSAIALKFENLDLLEEVRRVNSSLCLEIAERKLGDEAKSRLAAIVEGSDDAIISKTLGGVITSWNRSAEAIYGYSAAEMIGQSISLLIPSDHPDDWRDILKRIARNERFIHYETIRLRKDGLRIDVSLTISPLTDREGEIVGASTIVRDITTRKRMEKERERLVLELQEALGNVKTLSGLLPICSYCMKIRNDKGYWQKLEAYIHQHSNAQFSHGICPECYKTVVKAELEKLGIEFKPPFENY